MSLRPRRPMATLIKAFPYLPQDQFFLSLGTFVLNEPPNQNTLPSPLLTGFSWSFRLQVRCHLL